MENTKNLNHVDLVFDDNIVALAGFEFGRRIFKEQLEGKIDCTKRFSITFPSNISIFTSSFTKGLLCEFLDKIGVRYLQKQMTVYSSNERLRNCDFIAKTHLLY